MKLRFSVAVLGLSVLGFSLAFAQAPKKESPKPQPNKQAEPAGKPQLPPGWTEADMQACMEAGAPGPMHTHLAEAVGTWQGKNTMWMSPGAEPVHSECTSTITAMMDGRFTKCEMSGDMPGMGPFNGFGIYGYDNVAKQFQSTWINSCGTGMSHGTGELSSDHKTMSWTYTHTCPLTKKPTVMRIIERTSGKDSKTMEIFGVDPKSGKEWKMMETVFTRKGGATTRSAGAAGTR